MATLGRKESTARRAVRLGAMSFRTLGIRLLALVVIFGLAETVLGQTKAASPSKRPNSTTKSAAPAKPAAQSKKTPATGIGVIEVAIDISTGRVISSRMFKSTGNKILDDASVKAVRSARFKLGTPPLVRIPITWTLTGFKSGNQSRGR